MELGLLAAFWLVSFSLVMTPGADWAYVISSGMRERALAPALGGMLLGYLAITLVVAAGVGALVAQFPALLSGMTIVGALYLLWLGIGVLRNPVVPSSGNDQTDAGWLSWAVKGFAISGGNPKALLLFLALLPQFTRVDAGWPVSAQMAALGFVQIINCAVIYLLVGLCSKMVLRMRPRAARMVSQFSGVAMISVALLLVCEQIFMT